MRVHDGFGNSSDWVYSPTRAIVPFDQGRATLSGGTTIASSSSYLGSFRRLSGTSHYARLRADTNRFQVIGVRCPSCGSFAVYVDNVKVATVSSYSPTTVTRAVLFTKSFYTHLDHTFVIRPLGTPGHPYVALDGFAVRRS